MDMQYESEKLQEAIQPIAHAADLSLASVGSFVRRYAIPIQSSCRVPSALSEELDP